MSWPRNLRSGRQSIPKPPDIYKPYESSRGRVSGRPQLNLPIKNVSQSVGTDLDLRYTRWGQPPLSPLTRSKTSPDQVKDRLSSIRGKDIISPYYGEKYDEEVSKADEANRRLKVFGKRPEDRGKRNLLRDRLLERIEVRRGGSDPPRSINPFAAAYYMEPLKVGRNKDINTMPRQSMLAKERGRYPTDEIGPGAPPSVPRGALPLLDKAKEKSRVVPFIRMTDSPKDALLPDKSVLEHEIGHHIYKMKGDYRDNRPMGPDQNREIIKNLPKGGFVDSKDSIFPSHHFTTPSEMTQALGQLQRQFYRWTKDKTGKGRRMTPSDFKRLMNPKENVPAHFKLFNKKSGEAGSFIDSFRRYKKSQPKKAKALEEELIRIMPAFVKNQPSKDVLKRGILRQRYA